MIDPTGRIVTLVRDYAAVAAITPRVRGGEKAGGDAAPFVVIRRLSSVPWIGNPGTETAGVTTVRYTALCYVAKNADGPRQAYVLAGAVHDAIQDHSSITYSAGSGRAVIYGIQEDSIGPVLADPVTDEPYVTVNFSVHALAQAVA